jgi:hypothetical protein
MNTQRSLFGCNLSEFEWTWRFFFFSACRSVLTKGLSCEFLVMAVAIRKGDDGLRTDPCFTQVALLIQSTSNPAGFTLVSGWYPVDLTQFSLI